VLKGTYVRPLSPVSAPQQLFSIAVDPTAERRSEASIVLSLDDEGVLLCVSPLPPTTLPEHAVIEFPYEEIAIQARRDAAGIHLSLVPVPVRPNPAQRSLLDDG